MVDGASKPVSIGRCRELLGTEGRGLSDEEIEAIRVQADAWADVLLDVYLDQSKNGLARSRQMSAVRSRSGQKMDLV